MSLFLPCETIWDAPLSGDGPEKQGPHWLGNIIYGFLAFVFKICFRYKIEGREHLRSTKGVCGAVLVGNHTSFLDVVMFYLAVRPTQWVRFMGRDTLFTNAHGFVGHILTRVGAFPVKRDSADRTALKRAATMLKRGEVVGMYPEGTRRGKGSQLPQMHSGAAFVARMGHAPFIPATVRNAENVKTKGSWRIHFPQISVEFGQPIEMSEFDFLPREDRLEAATWYVMRECFALSARIPAQEVAMRELFPVSRDFSQEFAQHPIRRGLLASRAKAGAHTPATLEDGAA
ncbi:MAG: lysophospholipid acyltransferase family protein [Raoultibacter sp.]